MLLLTPFAIAYLVWCETAGIGAFSHAGTLVDAFLVASGVITAIPLVLFAYGARRIPLSTLGVIQFIGPSLQLVCGLLVFEEPFPTSRAAGFVLIWIGLVIYAVNGWRKARLAAAAAVV
jgi:chloramphenicol-sensitive protein RarD